MKPGPKHPEFTDEMRLSVRQDAAFGATQKEIAKKYGMPRTTFRRHLQVEFDAGKAWANQAVAKSLFWSATVGKNVTAQIWWEKTRAGMREPTASEHASTNKQPPPKLGISFEDGGPGKERADDYVPENDPNRHTPAGRDALALPGDPVSTEIETAPGQVLLPKREVPKSVLEQFKALAPEGNRREPIVHQNIPGCPCDDCIYKRATFGHSHYVPA